MTETLPEMEADEARGARDDPSLMAHEERPDPAELAEDDRVWREHQEARFRVNRRRYNAGEGPEVQW